MTYIQKRTILKTIKLNVESAEQFRDELPTSGLFDMTDCRVLITTSANSHVSDLSLITKLLEGAINVIELDFNIESRDDIEILIQSIKPKYAR